MERQKSMDTGLLRKSLSIRERKVPNDDVFLEAGLLRKSPREIKKPQNDDGECRVTSSVFLSTFVAVSGSFCTGCGVGFSSGAQAGITEDLSLSVAEYAMFGSILTLGGLIGAIFSGKVADVLGRKRTMLFCEAFCVTGWLAVALAQDALWLDCGRLLLGIGVGLFSYVIPVYIAEIAPKHVRGSFVFANQLMQNCGISLFFIVGISVSCKTGNKPLVGLIQLLKRCRLEVRMNEDELMVFFFIFKARAGTDLYVRELANLLNPEESLLLTATDGAVTLNGKDKRHCTHIKQSVSLL